MIPATLNDPDPTPGELAAATARLLHNDAVYRREAALGQTGVDAAITTAVADWRLCHRRSSALVEHGQDAGGELREAAGILMCIGRLLALKAGLPVEHCVSAFNRGRYYMDRLDAANRPGPADAPL